MRPAKAAPCECGDDGRQAIEAIAYSRPWRIIAGALIALSRGSLVLLLALVVWSHTPILPLMLLRALGLVVIAPGIAAWLIERACLTIATIDQAHLVLRGRERRIEIPCGAIARLEPWTIPLPGSGLQLRLRSGRRFRYGLQLADPTVLMRALTAAADSIGVPVRHPAAVYAHAKHSGQPWHWYHWALKFVAFALVPAVPLFRLKQLITYGGLLGQYYQLGLRPYAQSFATYWAVMIVYLILYAAAWRAAAEAVALATAWVAPSRAARVRRAVEIWCRILYYGGIPALLVRFFFAA